MKKLPTGALIELTGLEEKITLNELKKTLINLGWDVSYADYNMGEPTAVIRLQEVDTAKDVIWNQFYQVIRKPCSYRFVSFCLIQQALAKLADNSFELKGLTIKAQIIDGERETEILQQMEAEKSSRMVQNLMKVKGKIIFILFKSPVFWNILLKVCNHV